VVTAGRRPLPHPPEKYLSDDKPRDDASDKYAERHDNFPPLGYQEIPIDLHVPLR
jgi:hypothetical protein